MESPPRSLELELLKELEELDYYVIKAPIGTRAFWREWQEKYGRARVTRIAIRHLLRRRLPREEYRRARNLLKKYDELLHYLETLRAVASSGPFAGSFFVEFGDEEEEG
ncbi:MAG: hypothetical protein GXO03_00875 [Aquificae bacterium]|nr:hypothetical protein [Aquificota bacterium]